MPQFNMFDAKTQLSSLVERAVKGEEIVIAKAGEALVKLTPVKRRQGIRTGTLKGKIVISDDFDDPLPHELLEAFNGRNEL
jgi:prevent-host-death family protein